MNINRAAFAPIAQLTDAERREAIAEIGRHIDYLRALGDDPQTKRDVRELAQRRQQLRDSLRRAGR